MQTNSVRPAERRRRRRRRSKPGPQEEKGSRNEPIVVRGATDDREGSWDPFTLALGEAHFPFDYQGERERILFLL